MKNKENQLLQAARTLYNKVKDVPPIRTIEDVEKISLIKMIGPSDKRVSNAVNQIIPWYMPFRRWAIRLALSTDYFPENEEEGSYSHNYLNPSK